MQMVRSTKVYIILCTSQALDLLVGTKLGPVDEPAEGSVHIGARTASLFIKTSTVSASISQVNPRQPP
jgi:hypothetical protein